MSDKVRWLIIDIGIGMDHDACGAFWFDGAGCLAANCAVEIITGLSNGQLGKSLVPDLL